MSLLPLPNGPNGLASTRLTLRRSPLNPIQTVQSVNPNTCFVNPKARIVGFSPFLQPMVTSRFSIRLVISAITLCMMSSACAQVHTDSWETVRNRGKGTVTALYDEIEPFIYTTRENRLAGVEFEIMQAFRAYVAGRYKIELTIDWVKAGAFDSIMYKIREAKQPGLFGWAYYSITPARKREVSFSLPYMPDINVLVTNNGEPMYATAQEFTSRLPQMTALSQHNTTMQEDILKLKAGFFPALPLRYLSQDYEILKEIEQDPKTFGYVPLSIYIVALQKGIRVKRQSVLSSKREGFAAMMPPASDWKPLMDEFISSDSFPAIAAGIVAKYLGSQVRDLVFVPATTDRGVDGTTGVELLSLEKEIVVQRLMDSAVQLQQHRSSQKIVMVALAALVIVTGVLYNRYRVKQRLSKSLAQQNEQILRQHEQIAEMNQLLQLKILQTRLNPHFLFNSLNAIQYFIIGDNKTVTLQYISRFASFLRKVIRFGDETHITALQEKEILEDYLWLEKCRFQDRLKYQIIMPENVHEANVLPLISLTPVEEALYKGILSTRTMNDGFINVHFEKKDGGIEIVVSHGPDTGEHNGPASNRQFAETSIDMLQQRLNLFNKGRNDKIRWEHGKPSAGDSGTSILWIPQPLFGTGSAKQPNA
ncbi:MAG: transporter substrate-binding domain-containing protein [Chitinophagaceae bacterium]|nr:MAG: transporter substrate-binding domain-containing protein [Chitinophagaceae bacterium]